MKNDKVLDIAGRIDKEGQNVVVEDAKVDTNPTPTTNPAYEKRECTRQLNNMGKFTTW